MMVAADVLSDCRNVWRQGPMPMPLDDYSFGCASASQTTNLTASGMIEPACLARLRTRRSQVRVLQGAPNQQLTATRFRARTGCEQFVRDGVPDGASSQIAREEIGRIPRRLPRGIA
jgi:hypothetical protein